MRSYYYRQNLLERLPDLESRIVDFLKANEIPEAKVPGYLISLENEKPSIKKIPFVPLEQLQFEFKEIMEELVES